MRENPLKVQWAAGEATLNGWLSIPSAVCAEVMASQRFNSLTIDMQHGLIDYQTALSMLQATAAAPAVPLVRIPWLEPSIAMKMLDAGALGVICPMVNSAADAIALVQACRYAPSGYRSVGPTRAGLYHDQYLRDANDVVLVIAQIETGVAVDNIDAILSVPGLDAIYVGPADLALTLGREPRVDQEDQVVLDALLTVADAARRRGIVAGIHCGTASYAHRMIEVGYQMVTVQNDLRLLASAAAAVVAAVREPVPNPASETVSEAAVR
jgi:4-hydroxy-2-oxoheptanedioate aldolase